MAPTQDPFNPQGEAESADQTGQPETAEAPPVDDGVEPAADVAESAIPEDEPAAETADRDASGVSSTDEDTGTEGDAEDDDEDAPVEDSQAPAGPGFGLLFQAPTVVAAPRRARRPRTDEAAVAEPETSGQDQSGSEPDEAGAERPTRRRGGKAKGPSEGTDGDGDGAGDDSSDATSDDREAAEDGTERHGAGRKRGNRSGKTKAAEGATDEEAPDQDATDHGDASADDGEQDDEKGGRRRRRRGGRGRNKGNADDSGEQGDSDLSQESEAGEQSQDQSGRNGSGDSDADPAQDEDGSGGSRRRRRRRRGGSGGGDQDDPPGTVTKVREARKDRDEPKGVKGSTRLEAKKQRRREGREAGRRRTIITEAEFLARRESVERVMVVRNQGERTQIGVLEDGVLVEHYVSQDTQSTMVGNVYLGRVQNVLPSMEAAFVDIGKGRNAVLYAGEVNWEAQGVGNGQARRIENALSSGDTVLVQVTKDPIGHKGARLTSQVSLPGRYLVYVPESSMTGISRKLPDTERSRLKSILKEVVPSSAGVIVRTAAEGASEDELRRDVERLTKTWEKLSAKAETKQGKKASGGGAPVVLHAEPDMTVRVIRDIFNEDFSSMVIQGDAAWQQITDYVGDVAPDLADRLSKHTGEGDIFAEYRIDEAIAKAMDRKVWLPSGGSLVIDRTEAMVVVDVNTGKFVGSGGNLEETVTKNNLEAAEEIVRQLRLRDIGGIIVIDFIDMVLESNRDLVVRRLLECLGRDRTKHQVAEVTSLGLVQMTRKRVGSGLVEVFSETCEHCAGRGIIVHSEPVDHHHGGNGSGGSGNGNDRGRRGGRDKGRKGGGEQASEAQRDADGAKAAQMAAIHAAAVKSIAGEPSEDDVADIPAESSSEGQDRAADSADAGTTASESKSAESKGAESKGTESKGTESKGTESKGTESKGTESKPKTRRSRKKASAPATSVESPSVAEDAGDAGSSVGDTREASDAASPAGRPEPVAAPDADAQADSPAAAKSDAATPPTRPRRGGRRAATSAGAPVALQAVDLTASSTTDKPLTTVAAGSSSGKGAGAAPVVATTAPARRKRARVTSDAGPPKATED